MSDPIGIPYNNDLPITPHQKRGSVLVSRAGPDGGVVWVTQAFYNNHHTPSGAMDNGKRHRSQSVPHSPTIESTTQQTSIQMTTIVTGIYCHCMHGIRI